MIAKVRIAPIEQWCEFERNRQNMEYARYAIGKPVEIDILSMRAFMPNGCHGRRWAVSDKSREELQGHGTWICEHMLEMD